MNLYEVLNINKEASQDDIKRAYKKLAIKYHPDKCMDTNQKQANESKFKEINEAYSVLSDPDKKARYDQFGTYEDVPNGGGMHGMNMNDVLRDIFGGGGPFAGMPGGQHGNFSFVFMDGMGNVQQGFGGSPQNFSSPAPPQARTKIDTIDIHIDINDIYYGETKNVEFEMLEQCYVCKGTGAQDPCHILKCMTCQGNGVVQQQMGPFFVQTHTCPSCAGQGTTVQHNKHCHKCKGSKSVYNKRKFELKLPKGIPNNYEVLMEGKGAYNQEAKRNNDIRFRFIYNINEPYTIDGDKTVHYHIKISLEELLAGFSKEIIIYKESIKLASDHYFNPTKTLVLHGMGIYDMQAERPRDLHIHFHIVYQDNERFKKYSDVFKKVLKVQANPQEECHNEETQLSDKTIRINQYL